MTKDDCGGCKDKPMMLYLTNRKSVTDVELQTALKKVLGYTDVQAESLVQFSKSKKHSLIFEGNFDKVMNVQIKLMAYNIKTEAKNYK